jgi:hypothetical protein
VNHVRDVKVIVTRTDGKELKLGIKVFGLGGEEKDKLVKYLFGTLGHILSMQEEELDRVYIFGEPK